MNRDNAIHLLEKIKFNLEMENKTQGKELYASALNILQDKSSSEVKLIIYTKIFVVIQQEATLIMMSIKIS